MFKNILAFFLATILALGCGGGGGGGSTMPRRPAILPEIPLQTLAHAPQAPIIDFDGSLRVGAGVAPELGQLRKDWRSMAKYQFHPVTCEMARDVLQLSSS